MILNTTIPNQVGSQAMFELGYQQCLDDMIASWEDTGLMSEMMSAAANKARDSHTKSGFQWLSNNLIR